MRGGWSLAILLAAVALAGCLGALDDGPETELEPAGGGLEASIDYTQAAREAAGNLTSKLASPEADPTEPGEAAIERTEYDFGYTVVQESDPGPAYTAKLNGTVVYPTEGEGPFPLVAVLHGMHGWCRTQLPASSQLAAQASEMCPEPVPVMEPIPNFAGYGYLAETLASHGFVVVNVNGNSVNEKNNLVNAQTPPAGPVGEQRFGDYGTQSRAQLILRTLDGFADVAAGQDPSPSGANAEVVEALASRVAMDEIGLVGHSRGGDGVTYAVEHNDERTQGDPHELAAVFAIAPTDFTDTRADDVPYAVLLPYCDGDVYTLWGAHLYDRTRRDSQAPVYQYVTMGANHNFYNTVWTDDGDDAADAEDPYCGSVREEGGGRLSPTAQQRHGEALIVGFLRSHLADEAAIEPWMRGRTQTPAGACPQATAPCHGLIHASYHPAPADRLVVESVADEQALDTNDLGGPVSLEGEISAEVCRASACPSQPNRQLAPQLTLTWNGTGTYAMQIPDEHRDVTDLGWLSLRAGVNFALPENEGRSHQDLALRLEDETGASATVAAGGYSQALFVPPGAVDESLQAEVTLNAIAVPLDAFEGVDLSRLAEIAIVTDRTPQGSIQVADIMLQR